MASAFFFSTALSCTQQDLATLQKAIISFHDYQCDTFGGLPKLRQATSPNYSKLCNAFIDQFDRCQDNFNVDQARLFCTTYYRPVNIEGQERQDLCNKMIRFPWIVPAAWLYGGYDPRLVPVLQGLNNEYQARALSSGLKMEGMDFVLDSKSLAKISKKSESDCVLATLSRPAPKGLWNSITSRVSRAFSSFDSVINDCLKLSERQQPGH